MYEVVWMRMLTLVFGATAFATSAILTSFFTGLALGSWAFGRVADRSRNPLRLYGWLEAGLAVFAFVMPALFAGVTHLWVAIARVADLGFYPSSVLRLALSFAALVVPAALMGGTLPVVARFYVAREERLGRGVAWLYAVNTLGAVIGALGAGFFLILLVGVRESAWLAGAVNLTIAGVALTLSRGRASEPAASTDDGDARPLEGVLETPEAVPEDRGALQGADGPPGGITPGLARLALWAIGLSGLCSLALEVLWTRSLVYFLDNSTHAFTTMLTAFLLGIAVGSALVARALDRGVRLFAAFGVVEVLVGISALLAVPVLAHATPVLAEMEGVELDPLLLWKWSGMRLLTSLSVVLVPTLLMGMTVPIAAKIYAHGVSDLGASLGRVYSANTFGGVVGALLAGFVLIPWLGVQHGIVLVGSVSGLIGFTLLMAEPALTGRRAVRIGLGTAVVVGVAGVVRFTGGELVLTSYKERVDEAEVLFYREGVGSTVKVFRDVRGDELLSIDGFPVAGSTLGMLDAQKALGNLPLLLSGASDARVGLVGFGAGGASWEVLRYDVERVDCVELVPGVIEAAAYLTDVNHGVLGDPRFNLIMGDGRNHALVSRERYDVVSIDATSPKMAGNGSLYTLEFYRLVRDRLADGGMAVQWLPFHLLSDSEMRMTARTFVEVFPHTTVWLSPLRHHGLLVGTLEPLRIAWSDLERKLERPGVREQLAPVGITEPQDVLAGFVMGERRLVDYVEGARINTDDHPYLEFTPAWSYFLTLRYATTNLLQFGRARESAVDLLVGADDTVRMQVERRYRATQHSISGDIYYYLGDLEKAKGEYAMALLIDPGDKNAAHPLWRYAAPGPPRDVR